MIAQTPPSPESASVAAERPYYPNTSWRYGLDRLFVIAIWSAIAIAIAALGLLLFDILLDGLPTLSSQFLQGFPSRSAERAGVYPALLGTIWVMLVVMFVSFPLGVGAGIYLEEFAEDNLFTRLVEININNLAGVPSIIYGLLGLFLFVRLLAPITGGRTVLSGGLTLALLILPVIIVATREALRAVPDSLRQGGYALGATRWQVIWEQVFPIALPGILTGTILGLSRAIGETAPLIVVGAVAYISFVPEGLQSAFTVLPIQIFSWASRPQQPFHAIAASGIIVLMIVLLLMNGAAIYLRNRFQKERL
ncbi:MAG: phosphate ABC transporter permease PstA [Chloroflexaceae bacterium]|nr:phosphate ABC transporter permease PstA [Chloroflexaceae bacterium]